MRIIRKADHHEGLRMSVENAVFNFRMFFSGTWAAAW